mmetsp:Transcript_13841/g.29849  ORF Transcript_13841/g.29849 Transcript_13841/m.29849 type:complete len:150 (-) Transcript_13841:218-667(-)
MFAAARTSMTRALSRRVGQQTTTSAAGRNAVNYKSAVVVSKRNMGGGGHWMSVSQPHTIAGEVCGFFTWLWVFYRAKHDLPVVLGMRHPWEHGEDPWAISDHVDNLEELQGDWEEFAEKSGRPGEDDDEEEEDEDDDNDDEQEEEDDDE